jgi:ribose transport system substrate-binding protein
MTQMKRLTAAGAAIFAAVALAACGSDNSSSTNGSTSASGGSGGGDGGDTTVAYISPVGAQIGQQQVNFGLERAAAVDGWKTRVLDANLSPDRQVSHVDTLINERVGAFASWTLDPGATAGAYTRAQDAGIPIIGVNSEGDGVTSTVWWEVNTCTPGGPWDQTADMIARARPGGRVIVMGGPPAPSIIQNVRCFTEAARRAGLDVIDQADNVRDAAAPAAQLAGDLLTKHGDVDAFWDYNDQTALGVSSAILNAGKRISDGRGDGIMVFGSNGDPDAIQAVREGRLTGSWDTDSVATGWAVALAMRTAMAAGDPKARQPNLTVRSILWTPANIGDYVDPEQRDYSFDTIPLAR